MLDDWEFETRIGVLRPEVRVALGETEAPVGSARDLLVNNCLDEISNGIHAVDIGINASLGPALPKLTLIFQKWCNEAGAPRSSTA